MDCIGKLCNLGDYFTENTNAYLSVKGQCVGGSLDIQVFWENFEMLMDQQLSIQLERGLGEEDSGDEIVNTIHLVDILLSHFSRV